MRTYASIHKDPRAASRRVRASLPANRPATIAGRAEIQRILHGPRLQAKLTVGAADDAYEREADRVADEVMRMPESEVGVQGDALPEGVQRACPECDEELRRQLATELPEEDEELRRQPEEEEEVLQSSPLPDQKPRITPELEMRIGALRGGGRPVPESVRAFLEPRFGYDFSPVQIHSGPQAAELARAVRARAFTVGRDVVFGSDEYAPATSAGRRLLAHELTHTVQQQAHGASIQRFTFDQDPDINVDRAVAVLPGTLPGSVQRASLNSEAELLRQPAMELLAEGVGLRRQLQAIVRPEINYEKATKRNDYWAARLHWPDRLSEIRPDWSHLWFIFSDHSRFSAEVAAFQISQGFRGRQVDGVLGPKTWNRLRPIGEVIVKEKFPKDSITVCTTATVKRMERGYRRATGNQLVTRKERSIFDLICQSDPVRMKEIPEMYRGTGPAGALAYIGKGTLVNQEQIWAKKALRPGAAVQTWVTQEDFERVKDGKDTVRGIAGHSFVFLRYVGDEKMKVLQYADQVTTKKRHTYDVWIGANLLSR